MLRALFAIAATVAVAFSAYAAILQLNSFQVPRTTYVKMGSMR